MRPRSAKKQFPRSKASTNDNMWTVLQLPAEETKCARPTSSPIPRALTYDSNKNLTAEPARRSSRANPCLNSDNIWGIIASNESASLAPSPGKKKSHHKFYKNGHCQIFGRGSSVRDRRGGADHFMVQSQPLPTREQQLLTPSGVDCGHVQKTTDHVWGLMNSPAGGRHAAHKSSHSRYHNAEHITSLG